MKLYKLTDENNQTYNQTQWGENITHTASGKGEMCGPGWLHAYRDPLLAILMNSTHANFANPRLWEAEGEVEKDDGLKVGCRQLTTTRRLYLPTITNVQLIKFTILCTQEIYPDIIWNKWADNWLNDSDRSADAARIIYSNCF